MLSKEYIDRVVAEMRKSGNFLRIRRASVGYTFDDAWALFEAIARESVPGFRVTRANSAAYAALVAWAVGAGFKAVDPDTGEEVDGDPDRGLYIAGNPGSGKTTAVRVLRMLLSEIGAKYTYGTDLAAMRWIDRTAAMICNDYARDGSFAQAQSERVLCVQDLGSEPRETLYMGNRHEVLRELLELRGDTPGRFTIITSNFNMASIRKAYGDRVWSRLHTMCNYLVLAGDDWRLSRK